MSDETHTSFIQCIDHDNTEVLRIQTDGDVIWRGRKVESDDEFKAAMIDLGNALKSHMHQAPAQPAIAHQLADALQCAVTIASDAFFSWNMDQDSKAGKAMLALAGGNKGYRADADKIHAALALWEASK